MPGGLEAVKQCRYGARGEAEFVRQGGGAQGTLAEGVDGTQTGTIHRERCSDVLIKAFDGGVQEADGGKE